MPNCYDHEVDIHDRRKMLKSVREVMPNLIVDSAAQPSHDLAAAIPFNDSDTNAVGRLNLVETVRRLCPVSPFMHMSIKKVYGDD